MHSVFSDCRPNFLFLLDLWLMFQKKDRGIILGTFVIWYGLDKIYAELLCPSQPGIDRGVELCFLCQSFL